MTQDNSSSSCDDRKKKGRGGNGILGGIYGMAFVGGAIYYIQHATSFWAGVLGVLKALVWPAVLMYKVLELMKM